jgi:hypothetical protein
VTDEAKAQRTKTEIDIENGTVTIDGVLYETNALPEKTKTFLALDGLRKRLISADNREQAFRDLLGGKIPTKTPAAAKISPWHQAIAAALVEDTKKSAEPLTIESAMAEVRNMDRATQIAARQEPTVVKHYRRLTGKKGSLIDLVRGPAPAVEEAA